MCSWSQWVRYQIYNAWILYGALVNFKYQIESVNGYRKQPIDTIFYFIFDFPGKLF